MPPSLIDSLRPRPMPLTRCVCHGCGAHVMTRVGRVVVEGTCGNCGSFDLVPLEAAASPDPHLLPRLGH